MSRKEPTPPPPGVMKPPPPPPTPRAPIVDDRLLECAYCGRLLRHTRDNFPNIAYAECRTCIEKRATREVSIRGRVDRWVTRQLDRLEEWIRRAIGRDR